jgi:DNA-binding transcriptional LysR family regulator
MAGGGITVLPLAVSINCRFVDTLFRSGRQMDRWQEMSSFVAVVDAGSFVAAADATGLSKAAVSRHVAALEERLGLRLLHRTTRRLSLTDDGQRFLVRARELLDAVDALESELSSQQLEAVGQLRINAPLSFGVLHLAPLWGRFACRHPRLTLDVSLNDRIVDLVDEGYDLAIRITNLPGSQLVSRQLALTRMVACASPRYLEQHGMPAAPADLVHHRVVAYRYWSTGDEWTFSGPDGELRVRTRPFLRTNNGDTCRIAALEHQGVVLQPDFIVGPDLKRGTLVEVMPGFRSLEIGIHAVYPSRKHLPVRTRLLVDYLVEQFRQPAWR